MKKSGQLRIIGGRWKRRLIRFPEISDLRPSPDMVRETLFNWLRNELTGSTCLDLYAGSGSIGFEAASRGADAVVMIEKHRLAIRCLLETRQSLDADKLIEIYHDKALHYLESTTKKFDLVFLDPPFKNSDIGAICQSLIRHDRLNDNAQIYIESSKSNLPLPIPSTWHIIRESQRGMVQSTLIKT